VRREEREKCSHLTLFPSEDPQYNVRQRETEHYYASSHFFSLPAHGVSVLLQYSCNAAEERVNKACWNLLQRYVRRVAYQRTLPKAAARIQSEPSSSLISCCRTSHSGVHFVLIITSRPAPRPLIRTHPEFQFSDSLTEASDPY
jgi:hypothetical protein